MWVKISIHIFFHFSLKLILVIIISFYLKKTMPCFLKKKKNKEITFIYSSIQGTRIFTNIFF